MSADTQPATRLRRDAQRNRQSLLDAARELIAEHGLGVSLDEIARRAGLGNATLYRHFPTRESLYAAAFADLGVVMEDLHRLVLGVTDGWIGLVGFAEGLCALTATNRGVCDLVMSGFPHPPSMPEGIQNTLRALVDRVQQEGTVRPDITFVDVQLAICSVLLTIPASLAVVPDGWRRHLHLTLDGLRPEAMRGELPSGSLTEAQFHEIALRLFPEMDLSTE